jgi:hypothetical protein
MSISISQGRWEEARWLGHRSEAEHRATLCHTFSQGLPFHMCCFAEISKHENFSPFERAFAFSSPALMASVLGEAWGMVILLVNLSTVLE